MKTIKTLLATIALLLCSGTMNAHDFEVDGIYYNILSENNKTVEVTFKGDTYSSKANEYTDSVTIPQKVDYEGNEYAVTGIGTEAFRACFKLLSVNIPDGVVIIGQQAFGGCQKLTSVAIPEGVTSIGAYAFDGCTSLTSVVIPEGVTSIGYATFRNCSSLTSVVIPEGVTSIGAYAFDGCASLASVVIPEGVTRISDYTFRNCSSLTSVAIPEGVTSIGAYAFGGCTSLASVVIPEGVTSIGAAAFVNCTSLTSVVIPEGVTSIGAAAFYGCTSLTSVKSLSSEEPEIYTSGESTFGNISKNAILYIPEGSSYPNWEPYFSKVEYLTEEEITVIEDVMPEVRKSVIYDINGLRVKDPVKGGIYIIDGEKVKL